MRNIVYRIRTRFSEPYRIRMGWGLRAIRTDKEMRALLAFCTEELKDTEHMNLNPKRKEVYKTTVKLIKEDSILQDEYIEEHIGWYWS